MSEHKHDAKQQMIQEIKIKPAPPSQLPRCRIPQRLKSARRIQISKPSRSKTANRDHDDVSVQKTYSSRSYSKTPDVIRLVSHTKRSRDGRTIIKTSTHKVQKTLRRDFSKFPRTETVAGNAAGRALQVRDRDGGSDFSATTSKNVPYEESITLVMDSSYHTGNAAPNLQELQANDDWRNKITEFNKKKEELCDRQSEVLQLYVLLKEQQVEMAARGEQLNQIPPVEDLRIMNVIKMPPEQLLQLFDCRDGLQGLASSAIMVDMDKLYKTPAKLVASCELSIHKRKELIDWFEKLKTEYKGISMSKLTKKLNDFNAENESMNTTLQEVTEEFTKDVNEIVDFLRKGAKETISLQMNVEDLKKEVSELSAHNSELTQNLFTSENLRTQFNKEKIEKLEKELKEDKSKIGIIKDRLNKAENQLNIRNDRLAQTETALEKTREENSSLERTLQQLTEKTTKLQEEFGKEYKQASNDVEENKRQLKEVSMACNMLQVEKKDLEENIQILTRKHNDAYHNFNLERMQHLSKIVDLENKFKSLKEENNKLDKVILTLTEEKETLQFKYREGIKEQNEYLETLTNTIEELKTTKQNFEASRTEIENCKAKLFQQTESVREIELKYQETIALRQQMENDLQTKDEYITELEKNQDLLERKLQEIETMVETSNNELSQFQYFIDNLKHDYGEFENLTELQQKIHEQCLKLPTQNIELCRELDKTKKQLKRNSEKLISHEKLLEQQNGIINTLTKKEDEQANIIKLLRNHLESRSKAYSELTQRLAENASDIDALTTNVETRKQQISQLEKIVLTLEDQLRKLNLQKRNDDERMSVLEKDAYRLEVTQSNETPVEKLDNLIKILEEELSAGDDLIKDQGMSNLKLSKYLGQRNVKVKDIKCEQNKIKMFKVALGSKKASDYKDENKDNLDKRIPKQGDEIINNLKNFRERRDEMDPKKKVSEQRDEIIVNQDDCNQKYNFINKTSEREDQIVNNQCKKFTERSDEIMDNRNREKVIFNMLKNKTPDEFEPELLANEPNNMRFMASYPIRDVKKCKMLKLTTHKLLLNS